MHTEIHRLELLRSGIYRIRNITTNKSYIGSVKVLGKRRREHLIALRKEVHTNKHLQASFVKYGEEAFVFEVLCFCDVDDLIAKEQLWLDKLKTYDKKFGYNIRRKADNNLGLEWSKEAKARQSILAKQRIEDRPEYLERLRKQSQAAAKSEIVKDKIRRVATGRKHSEETKARISIASTGRKHTLETRQKISEIKKERISGDPCKLLRCQEAAKRAREAKKEEVSTETKVRMTMSLSKLTEEYVIKLRSDCPIGKKRISNYLAREAILLGVPRMIIYNALIGRSWKYLSGAIPIQCVSQRFR